METAKEWRKRQEHLPPANLNISQTIGNTLKHLDLDVTAFYIAVGRPVIEVVMYRLPLMLWAITTRYCLLIIRPFQVENDINTLLVEAVTRPKMSDETFRKGFPRQLLSHNPK